MLIDYSYTIRDNALPTFHRDVTSSMRVMRTRFPVYTLILYLSSGPMCPGSHRTYPFTLGARREHRRRGGGTAGARVACTRRLETLASLRGVRKLKGGGDCKPPRRKLLSLCAAHAHDTQGRPPSSVTGSIQAALRPFVPIDFYNNA